MEEGILYRRTDDIENLTIYGYDVSYALLNSNWSPHYHRALEIIYILEGRVVVFLGRQKHLLKPGDFVVIDSMLIHEVVCRNKQSAGVIIEISKKYMKKFLPDFEVLNIQCSGTSTDGLDKEHAEAILYLKDILHRLALVYKEQNHGFMFRSSSIMMEILALLVEKFSTQSYELFPENMLAQLERLGSIIEFVERNYQRPISLQEAADHAGLNREYFCRYFKKNVGYSFQDFLTNVRLNHIYKDLLLSTDPIGEVIDRNGITNQKLFYRKFKEKFSSTPAQVRKPAFPLQANY